MSPEQQPQNLYGHQPTHTPSGPYPVTPAVPGASNNGHTGHNPYEFIVAQNAAKKKSFGLPKLGHGSLATRLAVVVGGGIVLIIIIVALVSLLSPANSSEALTKIAQRQAEITRIAELASDDVNSQEAKNLVANVSASVGSGQQQMTSYLTQHKIAITPAILALAKDTRVDAKLQQAKASGTYNTVVTDTLIDQITTYALLLKSTYQSTTNDQTKKLLSESYLSAIRLLEQAKALQTPAS